MVVITRNESRILKNQRKFRIPYRRTVLPYKALFFYKKPTFKRSVNRINIPIVKKSYKNPARNPFKYIPCVHIGLYYLIDKYKCFHFSSFVYDSITKKINPSINFFKMCKENNILYVYVLIKYKEGGHANVLVINNIKKTIHLFEPQMDRCLKNEKIDILKQVNEYLQGYTKTYSEIIPLQRTSPLTVFFNEVGYCFVWCVWFIEICIINENINPFNINERLSIIFFDINTLQYIRGYSCFYAKILKKLNISKIPKNYGNISNTQETERKINLKLKEYKLSLDSFL